MKRKFFCTKWNLENCFCDNDLAESQIDTCKDEVMRVPDIEKSCPMCDSYLYPHEKCVCKLTTKTNSNFGELPDHLVPSLKQSYFCSPLKLNYDFKRSKTISTSAEWFPSCQGEIKVVPNNDFFTFASVLFNFCDYLENDYFLNLESTMNNDINDIDILNNLHSNLFDFGKHYIVKI